MIVAIVQARVNSSRLPGKVLCTIAGDTMLGRVVGRVRQAVLLDQVIVATSTNTQDDAIQKFCDERGIVCVRGSESDVLDRFYQAARQLQADAVVRVTADCPLIDSELIDQVIHKYRDEDLDYVSNTLHCTYPDGLDVEVMSFTALERAWQESKLPAEREHVTPYLRTSGQFRVAGVALEDGSSLAGYRWTVDDADDLEFVCAVYEALADRPRFGWRDVLRLLRDRPELLNINFGKIRNEGYYRSLRQEAVPLAPVPRSLARSQHYLERARRVIPSQTQTFSKGPTQFVQGVSPVYLARGNGSTVWDVDGNAYIDYIAALGPVVLGYDYPAVTEAAIRQLRDGVTLSLPHPLEVELAELLVEVVPCAEMVRFAKNGSDATAGAVRVARAYTGREKIACCGYHGWQDWYIGTTTRRRGVPRSTQELTLPFQYNSIASLERLFAEHPGAIAAVILEPVGVVAPQDDFLQRVVEVAHHHGAVVIFDEVVTGFRLALGGAQQYFGVTPDLACLGKALANGFPLAAVAGQRDLMQVFDEVFFSFTFGGEAVSLAAALATVHELQARPVIDHLWHQGQRLQDGYNVLARDLGLAASTDCVGLAPRTVMNFYERDGLDPLVLRGLIQQELVKRQVLFLVGNNISYSHTDHDIEHTLRAYRAALEYLARALASGTPDLFLDGPTAQPVFRRAG